MKDVILTGEAIFFILVFLFAGLFAVLTYLTYADVSEKEKKD